jgi:hypothetical protein
VVVPDVKVHIGSRLGGTVVVVFLCMRGRVYYGGLAVSVFVGSMVRAFDFLSGRTQTKV